MMRRPRSRFCRAGIVGVLRISAILSACLALLAAGCTRPGSDVTTPTATATAIHPPTPTPPNVVVIVTDDQRWDSLGFMPTVSHELQGRGMTFKNAFVVNSLCCPSRASILTGNYSHTTGVYTSTPPHGGAETFDPTSTLATWLSGAGYHTGLSGKYLNHYRGRQIPPGWDDWVAFTGPYSYYDYAVDRNGSIEHHGSRPRDYSTTMFGDEAQRFITEAPVDQPLFLYYAPFAPHSPATPSDRYQGAMSKLPEFRPPNYNESDVSDKPAWLRRYPAMTPAVQTAVDQLRRQQLQALLSVDDEVDGIIRALRETGRLHDTVILFTSDNGYAWGEHRWKNKLVPYEESIRVPLIVRYDALDTAGADGHLVANIDIAPTIAALAGIDAPPTDGRSLVGLIEGSETSWRTSFLIEHLFDVRAGGRKPNPPTYCALRATRYLLVRYATGEGELYDLRRDPYELSNVDGAPSYRAIESGLERKLRTLCSPRPPGMPPLP
jgi:N-acetylglucosamine-6-sulfatase